MKRNCTDFIRHKKTGSYFRAGLVKEKLSQFYLVNIIFFTEVKLVPSIPVASI